MAPSSIDSFIRWAFLHLFLVYSEARMTLQTRHFGGPVPSHSSRHRCLRRGRSCRTRRRGEAGKEGECALEVLDGQGGGGGGEEAEWRPRVLVPCCMTCCHPYVGHCDDAHFYNHSFACRTECEAAWASADTFVWDYCAFASKRINPATGCYSVGLVHH